MRLSEIIKARMTVAMLYREKIAGKLAYKFLKFLTATETDERFYREKLQEIIEKYGEKDEGGNFIETETGIQIQKEYRDDCHKAIVELESTEVDKPSLSITYDELEDIKISTEGMTSLFAFIEETKGE